MIISLIFYLVVCIVAYVIWSKDKEIKSVPRKAYSKHELLSNTKNARLPEDWRSVEDIKKSLQPPPTQRINRYKAKALPKARVIAEIDNKENFCPVKKTFSDFLLKEVEDSIKELKTGNKPVSFLNPNASEFVLDIY